MKHLIIDPVHDACHLAQLMKRVAGRQTRYVNMIERRTGSLCKGRFKSSPISTDEYFLACCRYIELNPLWADIVTDPADYLWSNYGAKIGIRKEGWLDADPCYLNLADSEEKYAERYMTWVRDSVPAGEWELIRQLLQRGQLTGSLRFVDEIEQKGVWNGEDGTGQGKQNRKINPSPFLVSFSGICPAI